MTYSFEKLCLPCYNELLAYAQKRTKCRARAEDIVQESVARALSGWARWEPQGDPEKYARAWMFRIVSNVFSLQYQRAKTFSRIVGDESSLRMMAGELHGETVSHHPYDTIDTIGDEVRDAMSRIRPEWAEVIELVYIEGLPAHEVAKILKIAPGTVRSRMARGRLALARILSPLVRQRFGYTVKPESTGGADEAHFTVESAQPKKPNTDTIYGIVADDDDSSFSFAQA